MAATTIIPSMTSNSANTSLSTIDSIHALARPRSVKALAESLDYRDVPVTRMLGKPVKVTNVKNEWTDERFTPISATADAAGYNNSVTTVNVASGHGVRIQVWEIIRNPATGELFQVTARATDALTVVRGVGGSSAASIAVSQAFDLLGPAVPENVASPASPSTLGEFFYNYCQEFDYAFQVSELENIQDNSYLVRGKQYDKEVAARMRVDAPRDLERTLIMGGRQVGSGVGGAGVPYMMGGIGQFITVNTTAKSGAAFTESDFLTLRQNIWNDVGPSEVATSILCGIFAKRVISSWVDNKRIYMDAMGTKWKGKLETIEDDLGTLQFVPAYHMPADTMFGVNFANLELLYLRDWYDEPLAKDGAYLRAHICGYYSLRATGDRAHFKITGFSTSEANYPTLGITA